jgi:hypothetical protein
MDKQITYNASASTWTPFNISFDSYTNADSATIFISAFYPSSQLDGPNGNSVLYVDNLSFDNHITSVKDLAVDPYKFNIYPNPASDIFNLEINKTNIDDMTLNIFNSIGKLVRSEMLKHNQKQINIEDLGNGIYMVEMKSKEWTETQKLIIQR